MNITLYIDGQPVTLEKVSQKAKALTFSYAGKSYQFRSQRLADGSTVIEREIEPNVWQRMQGFATPMKGGRVVQLGGLEAGITEAVKGSSGVAGELALSPVSPMPGIIRQILVKAGDRVKREQPLVIMEAMKLQTTLSAGGDAIVDAILVKEGELVGDGVELVKLSPLTDAAA